MSSAVQVDGKTIIFSTAFMIRNEQEVRIDVPIDNSTLKLSLVFTASESKENRALEWKTEDGITKFSILGWNYPLGVCTLEPAKFGNVGTKRLFFQLATQYLGEVYLGHFFVLLGD